MLLYYTVRGVLIILLYQTFTMQDTIYSLLFTQFHIHTHVQYIIIKHDSV